MQTTIAQVVALTVHGNASLANLTSSEVAGFYPANSTFLFDEYVKFVTLLRKDDSWHETAYASDPLEWFRRLKQDQVSALRMSYGPMERKVGEVKVADHNLVGFVGGGGRWLIEAIKPFGSDYWQSRWEVGNRNRVDKKIWRVTYGCIAQDQPSSRLKPVDLELLKNELGQKLTAIAEFASAHKLDQFAKAFHTGLSCLTSPHPVNGPFHTDIVPKNFLPTSAAQLLAAAQSAWVFGGMGSWNDVGFTGEDQAVYEQLTAELYRLLNEAIVMAANSRTASLP